MAVAIPAFAAVRPRVRVNRTSDIHLLDDIVVEFAEEYSAGLIAIAGGPGSGKSTALAHLAALLAHRPDIHFLDEPAPSELQACREQGLVVVASSRNLATGIEFVLQPWGTDQLIEYLLAVHHDDCRSVMARLGSAAHRSWCPQLAAIVLDQFASAYELHDASDALVVHVQQRLTGPKQETAATEFCYASLTESVESIVKAGAKLAKAGCSDDVFKLLRHQEVQLPLAAARVLGPIHQGHFTYLEKRLPNDLIEILGWQCAASPEAMTQLRKSLALRRGAAAHAMAASVLLVAEPSWRPEHPPKPWRFASGVFRNAAWNGVNLFRANLEGCDFSSAALRGANLELASLAGSQLSDADLRDAKLIRANAPRAIFDGANMMRSDCTGSMFAGADLTNANLSYAALNASQFDGTNLSGALLFGADLSQARLVRANLTDTDFGDANLSHANISGVDLRTARLSGACFHQANLSDVQLEDVYLAAAQFESTNLAVAHLTGSILPGANFRHAILRGAGLAEIDWEEADLQNADLTGASFHMGSSRSGLVNSPFACEGSKTGFYTDDYEDLNFKRPEEVRKANLRGADLRGAKAKGVDFYLVDLREAKLDPLLREQAAATGAILFDPCE